MESNCNMKKLTDRLKKLCLRFEDTFFYRNVFAVLLIICLTVAQSAIIQIGGIGLSYLSMSPGHIALEAAILFCADAVIAALTGRWWIAYCVTSVFSILYGIANHYTVDLHGSPLTLREMQNTGAAMAVMGSYELYIDYGILIMLAGFLCCAAAVLLLRRAERKEKRRGVVGFKREAFPQNVREAAGLAVKCVCAVLSGVLMFFAFSAEKPLINVRNKNQHWVGFCEKNGCISYVIYDRIISRDMFVMPEGYSEEQAAQIEARYAASDGQSGSTPDVIYILNESLFDMTEIMDIEYAEHDPLEELYALDGVITGHTVVPDIGGGTNKSEYELLSGNSLYLIPGVTPFNSLDLTGASSVVSQLEALGYTTLGSHSQTKTTYKRGYAYNALGFDRAYFSEEFTDLEQSFGKRYYTDESLYGNLLRWYDEMGDGPRFEYLLTMQNHGDYKLLQPQDYTIHAKGTPDGEPSKLNEYLSSLELSAEAFVKLTEHFRDSERPVVICMTGDHAPSFVKELTCRDLPKNELNIAKRSTPYFVWANFDLDESCLPERVGMSAFSACVLDSAGIELTGCPRLIADMSRETPVVTTYGVYMTADGELHKAESFADLPQDVRDYFFMEYRELTRKAR